MYRVCFWSVVLRIVCIKGERVSSSYHPRINTVSCSINICRFLVCGSGVEIRLAFGLSYSKNKWGDESFEAVALMAIRIVAKSGNFATISVM